MTLIYTRISNKGIADRLKKDVVCFEAYGFEYKQREEDALFVARMDRTEKPLASVEIQVKDASLVSSIGPFLRALVRLCVDPIDPRSLRASVVIHECRKQDKIRSIAHEIHMLIRNSMGAALFLDLHITIPPGMAKEKILDKMKDNDDGCYEYPSVILHDSDYGEQDGRDPFIIDLGLLQESPNIPPIVTKPLSKEALYEFDPKVHYLSLHVTTRMCTVRLTPLIYHLSQRLLRNNNNVAEQSDLQNSQNQSHPLIVVCLEKVSNLYRILMLMRDYGGVLSIGKQLVLVCDVHSVDRFDSAAKDFVTKNFLPLYESNTFEHDRKSIFPKVISIENASIELALLSRVVGIDLHEDAKTLVAYDNTAISILASAQAIVFGFESDGIPEKVNQCIFQYVQVQSRTSINVVAAVAIFLHAIS